MRNIHYLGDGVYVHFDAQNSVVLTTGHHLPTLADNTIILEMDVIVQLLDYLKQHGYLATSKGE